MPRSMAALLLVVVATSCGRPRLNPAVMTVCDLSRDYAAFRDKLVAVRGVYYYGLRQDCPQKCVTGPWPSFLDLIPASRTDEASWAALERVQRSVEAAAKQGKRLEIWVTAVGELRTRARHSPLGPCDKIGSEYYGYGHLGAAPAQLVVRRFDNVEIRTNQGSPYDYGNIYRGPA